MVEVEPTKKMRCNPKDKQRKQGVAEGTDKFHEGATEWLGYGAAVKVKFKGEWCTVTVIGRKPEGVVIRYADGIGVHRDLHRGGAK